MRNHQMMELKRRKNQNTKGMRLFIPILFVRCLRTLDDNLWANFDSIDKFFFCCPLTLRSVCDPRNTNLTPRKAARKCRVDLGQGSDDSGRNESRNINGRSLNAVISIHLLGTGHTTFRSDESTEMASPERPIDWNKTPHTKFATGVKKPVKCVHLVSLIYWAKELCGILCGTPQFIILLLYKYHSEMFLYLWFAGMNRLLNCLCYLTHLITLQLQIGLWQGKKAKKQLVEMSPNDVALTEL